MAIHHVPSGFHAVTPYFHVNGAAEFLEFAKAAFGAEETYRSLVPNTDKIMHASARIDDSMIECSDATDKWQAMPCAIHLYLKDTDAAYKRAIGAGGVTLYEPTDMFYGERSAGVRDPFGNCWYIATHTEDLSEDELERRAAVFAKQQQQT